MSHNDATKGKSYSEFVKKRKKEQEGKDTPDDAWTKIRKKGAKWLKEHSKSKDQKPHK